MSEFVEYRQRVLDYFDDCVRFADQYDFKSVLPALYEARNKIGSNQIYIMICGEMKRGKSSLLAALLEDVELFPVDVAVATCVITIVRYAKEEKITAVLVDEQNREVRLPITRTEIRSYAMEQYNARNQKRVRYILVETPNEQLKDGFVFIDTPGVGSLNPEHSVVTYSILPQADIVLFVSDALSPLTETELSFLKQVRRHCQSFLYVLTKKDRSSDYPTIIGENKAKIEQATGVPTGDICYIPVSSTMKLSYLKTKNDRLLKSSQFEELKKTLWDTIYRNRADIIISPPLATLAEALKTIKKDIGIRSTGIQGSGKEQAELEKKLSDLMEQRQALLDKRAVWQDEVTSQIKTISYVFSRMIQQYQVSAQTVLEEGVRSRRYLNHPEQLLNQVICLSVDTSRDISEAIYQKLMALHQGFVERNEISLYNELDLPPIEAKEDPKITFEMKKTVDRAIEVGRRISMNGMGGGVIGSAIGGVIGAIIGLSAGPAGVIYGAQLGAAVGSSLGAGGGMVRGATLAVTEGSGDPDKIKAVIQKYISHTVDDWIISFPPYLDEVTQRFIDRLRETAEESRQEIENDIKVLRATAAASQEIRETEKQKLLMLQADFNELTGRLAILK